MMKIAGLTNAITKQIFYFNAEKFCGFERDDAENCTIIHVGDISVCVVETPDQIIQTFAHLYE